MQHAHARTNGRTIQKYNADPSMNIESGEGIKMQ